MPVTEEEWGQAIEAINAALTQLGSDEVRARLVHVGVGGITESDVALAAASGSPVIGFNVRANAQARRAAEQDGIEIPFADPESFLRAAVEAGVIRLEVEE